MSLLDWFRSPRSALSRARAAQPSRRNRRQATRRLAVESLEDRCLLAVAPTDLLIFPGPVPPSNLTDVSGTLFFAVNNLVTGGELWKSDGTPEGTVLIRTFPAAFCPICLTSSAPAASSLFLPVFSSGPANLTNLDGTLFFTADDGIHGTELWRSDGTPEGTVMVRDINPDVVFAVPAEPGGPIIFPLFPNGSFPSNLTVVNGTLFFTAFTLDTGIELWRSDGTEEGTVLVKDIHEGGGFSFAPHDGSLVLIIAPPAPNSSNPSNLTNVNGTLFFTAGTAETGRELWRSDGSAEGTFLVADINPGILGSDPGSLTVANGLLLFTATTPETGRELWRSDGSAEGTSLVIDLNPGSANAFAFAGSDFLVEVFGAIYFTATTPETGRELWWSDGTAEGTFFIRDINPGPADGFPSFPIQPRLVNGVLYFAADDGATGMELWRTDGTIEGTFLVSDINPGSGSAFLLAGVDVLAEVDGVLFFTAFTPETGRELWRSDGSAEGTFLVRDLEPGSGSSFPSNLTALGGVLYFSASTPLGSALWRSDGTEEGTVVLRTFPFEFGVILL